jgi:hypothetical protein
MFQLLGVCDERACEADDVRARNDLASAVPTVKRAAMPVFAAPMHASM